MTTPERPTFMADDLPRVRPALDRDAVGPGSPVVVTFHMGYKRWTDVRAVVLKKARVWIDVIEDKPDTHPRNLMTGRFRLDTQDDGSKSHYAARFKTPEQHRWDEARHTADLYLREQGVIIDWQSPWKDRMIDLARLVWTDENTPTGPGGPLVVHHLDGTVTSG